MCDLRLPDPCPRDRDLARGLDGRRDAHLDTLEVLLQILPVAQAVAQRVRGRGLHVFVHATGRGEPRVGRTELQTRPAGGASATAPVRFRARAAVTANGKRPSVICARAPPLGAANRSQGRELGGGHGLAGRLLKLRSDLRVLHFYPQSRLPRTTHKIRRHVLLTL